MLKNIYFRHITLVLEFYLDVVFENTRDNGTITNYIPEEGLINKPIINLLRFDQLNAQQERKPDGIWLFTRVKNNY